MADKKPKKESVTMTTTNAETTTLMVYPVEGQDMFDRIFNRIAERSKALKDLRNELVDAKVARDLAEALLDKADTELDNAMKERGEAQDLAEERKTQREAAYTAQREAEARAEHAEGVLDRFRALPEFADLFGEDET